MSIFSKIKGAKKAADKHKKAKSTEIPVEQKDVPIPYRHIPTHAAIDALTGAPASWREEDRAAIKYQHHRRSMITRNNSAMSSGGTLYHNNSYSGSDFSSYGMTAAPSTRPSSSKLDTRRSYQGPGQYQPSPLGSTGPSPTGSEHSNSSSSSHLVELPVVAPRPQMRGQHLSPMDHAPRHTTRKIGEAPLFDKAPLKVTPVTAPIATPTPVNSKKRSWGFMKRNSQAPAIAAH
ncbi:MAG: hypothetical protein Q9202_007225 [Teloschistes flavicans]